MTRVYTPDATGRCTVCARPEAEHARSGGWEGDEARCMPEPAEVTAESLGDIDFMDFSSKLRTEMDQLDGAEWQAAEDLRQDCRTARVYNNEDAKKRVAAAINARAKGGAK